MSTLVLLGQSQENPTPPIAFSGSGDVTVGLVGLGGQQAGFTGDSAVTIGGLQVVISTPVAFSGSSDGTGSGTGGGTGTGTGVTGTATFAQELQVTVLDDTLIQAPTSVTVMVVGGWPGDPVDFSIDGTVVYSDTLDSDGDIGPISINVPDTVLAGSHTITVAASGTGASVGGSDTFSLAYNPPGNPRAVGADADPIAIPAAVTSTGVYRWVLQDLMPGGLGSYVLPRNPISQTPPPFSRTLNQEHSTAIVGMFHVTESGEEAHPFSFTGFATTQAEADQLRAFADLKRRYYLIDHRNRAWIVASVGCDLTPRRRYSDMSGVLNDWGQDYTMRVLIHDSVWKVPQ